MRGRRTFFRDRPNGWIARCSRLPSRGAPSRSRPSAQSAAYTHTWDVTRVWVFPFVRVYWVFLNAKIAQFCYSYFWSCSLNEWFRSSVRRDGNGSGGGHASHFPLVSAECAILRISTSLSRTRRRRKHTPTLPQLIRARWMRTPAAAFATSVRRALGTQREWLVEY